MTFRDSYIVWARTKRSKIMPNPDLGMNQFFTAKRQDSQSETQMAQSAGPARTG